MQRQKTDKRSSRLDIRHYGYIYVITNIVTGKKYIGQTWDYNRRIKVHILTIKKGRNQLYIDTRNGSKDDWVISILTEGYFTGRQLDDREISYISIYDTYKNGYNKTAGGHGQRGGVTTIYNDDTIAKIKIDLVKGDTIKSLSIKYNVKESTIKQIKLLKSWDYIMPELNQYLINNKKYHTKSEHIDYIGVRQTDKDGNIIAEYKTLTEAAEAVGADISNISAVCRAKVKTYKTFIFCYILRSEVEAA